MQAGRSALQRRLAALGPALKGHASQQVRRMSGAISHEEEVKEMWKWRYVTIAAIPVCIGVGIYDLSQPHKHEDQIVYPYMHIRTKDYPWGPCTLFDMHCWEHQKHGAHEEEAE